MRKILWYLGLLEAVWPISTAHRESCFRFWQSRRFRYSLYGVLYATVASVDGNGRCTEVARVQEAAERLEVDINNIQICDAMRHRKHVYPFQAIFEPSLVCLRSLLRASFH
jgi:hypothetical protein